MEVEAAKLRARTKERADSWGYLHTQDQLDSTTKRTIMENEQMVGINKGLVYRRRPLLYGVGFDVRCVAPSLPSFTSRARRRRSSWRGLDGCVEPHWNESSDIAMLFAWQEPVLAGRECAAAAQSEHTQGAGRNSLGKQQKSRETRPTIPE